MLRNFNPVLIALPVLNPEIFDFPILFLKVTGTSIIF